MQEDLAALEELQKLDLENLDLKKELERIPTAIDETRRNVVHVGEILERERDRLKEAEQWRSERERDVSIQNELLSKSKTKLQSARNEKESKAAQREIDTIRKNISEREKEALEFMETIEQYRIAIQEHTKEFAELQDHLKATEEDGAAKVGEIRGILAKTEKRRSELAQRVPQKLLRQYERIHKRLGLALVEAFEGRCTGCNISIQPQMYIDLQRGDSVFTCPNCFRILVYKKKEEQPDNFDDLSGN